LSETGGWSIRTCYTDIIQHFVHTRRIVRTQYIQLTMVIQVIVAYFICTIVVESAPVQDESGITKLNNDQLFDDLQDDTTFMQKMEKPLFTANQRQPPMVFGNQGTFNRPVGTEAMVLPSANNQRPFTVRTSGQYGSYRKQKSWQTAVAQDRMRNMVTETDNLRVNIPWFMNNLQQFNPQLQGFGLNGFWNSYALRDQMMDSFMQMVSVNWH